MACSERSEHECKSYPKCEGCNAYTKNLTFKHRFPTRMYKDGEWDNVAVNNSCYTTGPIVDRLHEFEKLGYEPEELKDIIRRWRMYRQAMNSVYGKCVFNYQDTDSLTHLKIEELAKFDIPSLYPQIMQAAVKNYVTHDIEATKKLVESIKPNVTVTKNPEYQFKIKRVLFNNPATIVFWADGDKTVVKCQNGEPYDPEKGLAMAISKKALGNDRAYYDEFQKQLGRGQKYSTPEQFNSEVCHIQKLEDYQDAIEDNKTNRALAYDALDYLRKAVNDPKLTKVNLVCAMDKAMECLNAILDNY